MNSPAEPAAEQQQNPVLQGTHFFFMLGAMVGMCQQGFQAGTLVIYGLPAALAGLVLCGIIHAASGDAALSAARIGFYQGAVARKAVGLVAFYWLFRWSCPEILPTELQTLTWAQILSVCLIGGALFALPAALMARLSPPAEAAAQSPAHA
jgi:hypothetical protein